MRILIDTHILIYHILKDDRLSRHVKGILDSYEHQIFVSAKSIEETIALQQGERIHVAQWKSANDIVDFIHNETHFQIKYIKEEHLRHLADLPYFKNHTDPFDRMIIAHAITENFTLVSGDTQFPRYTKHGLELIFNKC